MGQSEYIEETKWKLNYLRRSQQVTPPPCLSEFQLFSLFSLEKGSGAARKLKNCSLSSVHSSKEWTFEGGLVATNKINMLDTKIIY